MTTHYCWNCYAEVEPARQVCAHCGHRPAAPDSVDYTDKLLWALHHPLPERRIIAARALGQRRQKRAAPALRSLLSDDEDPYLQAAALSALLAIDGAAGMRPLIEELSITAPAPVRRVAQRALAESQ